MERTWIVVAALSVGMVYCGSAEAKLKKRLDLNLLPGYRVTLSIEWTKDGVSIEADGTLIVNNTTEKLEIDETFEGPDDANDMAATVKIKREATADADKTSGVIFPDLVPNLIAYLTAGGYGEFNPFDMPLVLGDVGTTPGAFDDLDASVYGYVSDLALFETVADRANFAMGSTLTADALGHVSGLPGMTFYSDETLTTPYTGQLLVTGIDGTYVPEPSMAAGLGLLGWGALRRRRKI